MEFCLRKHNYAFGLADKSFFKDIMFFYLKRGIGSSTLHNKISDFVKQTNNIHRKINLLVFSKKNQELPKGGGVNFFPTMHRLKFHFQFYFPDCIGISSRKFENFELFCPLGEMKLGVQQKKLLHLIQPSQDPTYIYFF